MGGLHEAARRGHVKTVLDLLEKGAEINSKDNDGRTPLHLAAREGRDDTVECLVEQGANISITDDHGMTPLHLAAERARVKVIEYLVGKEADIVNIQDLNGLTALHIAAREGRDDTVECLVEQGADISIKDDNGMTPLHLAAERARVKVIEYLVGKKADIVNIQDLNGQTALHIAASKGRGFTVKCLVKQGANIIIKDKNEKTPLDVAVESDSVETAKFLLREPGVMTTCLHLAFKGGHMNTVKYLVDKGADINTKDGRGMTHLHLAVQGGHMNTVKYLVNNRADINTKDDKGRTPLHMAAREGYDSTVEFLVDEGADINMGDCNGWTPLHVAAREGYEITVKTLVCKNADIDIKDEKGMTPLHVAAKSARFKVVECLVYQGANISTKDNDERTPLHTAAAAGYIYTVKHLVKNGADINIKDNRGQTALDLADEEGHTNVSEFLKEAGEAYDIHNLERGQSQKEKADSRPDSEDSEEESHVESTTTNTTSRKRTADSRSDEEDSEKESLVESTTTNTTGRKRIRTAVIQSGESAVPTERKLDDREPDSRDSDALLEQVELNLKMKSLEAENEKLRKQLDKEKPKSSYDSFLRVEVVGEKEFVVTNEALSFQWKDHGFKLHVPKNALPEGIPEYSVNIKASLAGQFKLPEGYELVSAVYWVKTPGKFAKLVTIEVQHCANFSSPNQLCFVRTTCTQKYLPYNFEIIDGGSFNLGTKYGALSITNFSGIAIVKDVIPNEHSCQYCAQVYFTVQHFPDYWYCHFVITKDLEMCLEVVKRKYKQEYDIAPEITFGGDHIVLDIPDDGTKTDNGWEIVPSHKAQIKKDRVDKFSSENARVPECVLLLKWLQQDKAPPPLEFKVKLNGTGEENDFFRIFRHPAGVTKHPPSSSVSGSMKYNQEQQPHLSQLICFKTRSGSINVLEQIGAHYRELGVLLLNDTNGTVTQAIMGQHPEAINVNFEILQRWIQGKGKLPVEWATLIEVLRDIKLSELAHEMDEALK